MVALAFLSIGRQSPAIRRDGGARARRDLSSQLVGIALPFALMLLWLGSTGLLAWPGDARAQSSASVYSCRDNRGRVITSDRPIPECANRPLREMNANGVTTRTIAAPLTQDELQRRADEQERARIQSLRERQERSRDRALLVTYENEQALEDARRRQIDHLTHEIELARRRMAASHRELNAANASLATMTNPGQIAAAKRRAQFAAQSILTDDAVIQRVRGEIAKVEQRFDDDGERLQELLRASDSAQALGRRAQLR